MSSDLKGFRVDDTVRVTKTIGSIKEGMTGTIVGIAPGRVWPFEVRLGDGNFVFNHREVELVARQEELPFDNPMTSQDLADEVGEFIRACQGRVLGVGKEQYDDGSGQKFERMPFTELLDWADEEIQDIAVYASMLSIRVRRIRAAFEGQKAGSDA